MSTELPKWPDRLELQPIEPGLAGLAASRIVYAEQLAEAAIARLKLAVEALDYCRSNMSKVLSGDLTDSAKEAAGIIHARAFNALHAIGQVP